MRPKWHTLIAVWLSVILIGVLYFLLNVSLVQSRANWQGMLLVDTQFLPADNPHIITNDLTVPAGITLTLAPGVEVQLAPGASLLVHGRLLAAGTPTQPITFTWRDAAAPWGALAILDSAADNRLVYVHLAHAGEETDTTPRYQGVTVRNGRLTIAHSELHDFAGRAIHAEAADLTLRDSTLHHIHGDALSAARGTLTVVRNHIYAITWDNHAYEGLSINEMPPDQPAFIRDNHIHHIADDCVDVNKASALLERNRLHHCGDKAVSIGALEGQAPNDAVVYLTNNLLYSATIGVAVKDDATAHLLHNTLVSHTTAALSLYNAHQNFGGGRAFVTNTIVWGARTAITLDAHSTVSVSFSDVAGGWDAVGNFDTPPLFSPDGDFRLSETSPCIDAGLATALPRDDLDSFPRPVGVAPDVGAYEWPPLRVTASARNEAVLLHWRTSYTPVAAMAYALPVLPPGTVGQYWAAQLPLTTMRHKVLSLSNGIPYSFVVDMLATNGTRLLQSNLVQATPQWLGAYLPLTVRQPPPPIPKPEVVAHYTLTLDPVDWAFLDENPGNRELVPAIFAIADTTYTTGVRYRGEIARWLPKKSWKIEFDQAQMFDGQRELNLNAEYPDKSLMREWLAYDLFARLASPSQAASQAHFATLTVNGEYRGLFTAVEQVDQRFLYRVGLDPNGNLYKGDYGSFHLAASPAEYAEQYIKKTNKNDSNADMVAFVAMLHAIPSDTLAVPLSQVFDVGAYLDWYAVQTLIGNYEWVEKNYYLHHDLHTGYWRFLPWDMDLSFGLNHNGSVLDEDLSWDNPIDAGTATSPKNDGKWNWLTTVILEDPDLRLAYCRRLREMLDSVFAPDAMAARIDHAYALIQSYGAMDPYKWGTNADFIQQPDLLKFYVTQRRAWLFDHLPYYCPTSGPLPRINEISVASDSAPGWLELYNPALVSVDVGEMRLQDASGGVWTFPANTVITPGGFSVIARSVFSLPVTGGQVTLYDKPVHGGGVLDVLAYPPLSPTVTFGCLDHGGVLTGVLTHPTPGWSNLGRPPTFITVAQTPTVPDAGQDITITATITGAVQTVWLTSSAFSPSITMPLTLTAGRVTATLPSLAASVPVTWVLHAMGTNGLVATTSRRYRVGYTPPPLVINELLAINLNGINDPFGEREDWIELYNAGPIPLDLSGYYLTDEIERVRKWQLPAGVSVPAGGYLLLWADDDPSQGPAHVGFKLDGDGERFALYAPVGADVELVDEVYFPPQVPDRAWGRMADGTWGEVAPSPGVGNP